FSQNVETGKEPLQYLILWESQGDIDKGEVVLFYPEDPEFGEFVEGDFQKMLGGQTCSEDGKAALISLGDRRLLEYQFSEGSLYSLLQVNSYLEHEQFLGRENCVWTEIVRHYYYLDTRVVFLSVTIWEGMVCNDDCLPYELYCDDDWGGGGGSGEPVEH